MEKHMRSAISTTRAGLVAGSAALLGLCAMGFAGAAQARDNVSISVGIGVPGVVVGASNAYPMYTQPVYTQPAYSQPVYAQAIYTQPVFVQPRPVYLQPAPVYVQQTPVYYQNAPVYYGRPRGHGHRGGGYYVQAPRPGHGSGYFGQRYAPVYYQR